MVPEKIIFREFVFTFWNLFYKMEKNMVCTSAKMTICSGSLPNWNLPWNRTRGCISSNNSVRIHEIWNRSCQIKINYVINYRSIIYIQSEDCFQTSKRSKRRFGQISKGILQSVQICRKTKFLLTFSDNCIYHISANSFRGNYSFLNLTLCIVTFGHSTYSCGNYSRK